VLLLRRPTAGIPILLLATACAEAPTAPEEPVTTPPELSVITPFLLPPGADWGLYFVSFNQNRTLNARVIHYPDGSATGDGSFVVLGRRSGVLRVTGATPYGDCLPNGAPCGTITNVPESAEVTGTAILSTGQQMPFSLDLHSNYWPTVSTYDTATLTLCYTSTRCVGYSFFGELHHEPQ
jgi:hypothetical protein